MKKFFHKWHIPFLQLDIIFSKIHYVFLYILLYIWFWNCKKNNNCKITWFWKFCCKFFQCISYDFFWNKLSRELSLKSFKFVDRLLTFDFQFTFTFLSYNFAQLILYSRPQGYHFSITKFTFCSINAKIYFWIISLFSF